MQAKPPRFLSRYPRLDFILAPRSVLSHPPSSTLISPLKSRAICEGKSFTGDFWTTGKVVSPGSKRGMLSWLYTYSDASSSGWGGIFPDESGNFIEVRDYWTPSDRSQPIVIREALALKNTILAGAGSLAASRVDTRLDSIPLVRAWSNQGGKSKALSDVI